MGSKKSFQISTLLHYTPLQSSLNIYYTYIMITIVYRYTILGGGVGRG